MDSECSAISRVKKRIYRHWLQSRPRVEGIEHKRTSAIARRTLRYARHSSWRRYVSSLRMDVSPSAVYSRVLKISRRYAGHPTLVSDVGGVLSAPPLEVGTTLNLGFPRHSSDASYSPNFRALRAAEESRPLSFVDIEEVPESYNIPFTMSELRFALALCGDGAVGPVGFSYPFLSYLHPTAMEFLLCFFNCVCTSELFPEL